MENTKFNINNEYEGVATACVCKTNCNPTIDRWCNSIVYVIYRGDDLKTLPKNILIQMILALEDMSE